MKTVNKLILLATGAATTMASTAAFAADEVNNWGNDYTGLTGKIDSVEISKAVVLGGGLMVGPRLARAGVRYVQGIVR